MENSIVNREVRNERELLRLIQNDIFQSCKERVVFLAGHFPLFYNGDGAYANTEAWGVFTPYSLNLACKLMNFTKGCWKDNKLVLLADDINYEDFGQNAKYDRHQKSRKRNTFYKKMSGKGAKLPLSFQEILDRNKISDDTILRHNHEKNGREDCLLFSESILRTSREQIETECAKSYRGLIGSNYINKDTDYFVAFIPYSCAGNVCSGILDKEIDWRFSSSHIMIQTDQLFIQNADVNSIWKDWGVQYRKDGCI